MVLRRLLNYLLFQGSKKSEILEILDYEVQKNIKPTDRSLILNIVQ